ncbi:hypothetical protein NU09_0568 [Flavobacterium beibuense]|uniref:Uncharacterized protein n=1 Tax=Flavobacterium beibuense TaxID=657326 RepID=A0A444WGU3_9FLAO|nr:hypothetical protein NU09_0568 [Flavobacterium beibuense]
METSVNNFSFGIGMWQLFCILLLLLFAVGIFFLVRFVVKKNEKLIDYSCFDISFIN